MGTPLNDLYKRFQTKIDEDVTGKENLIFSMVDSAIARSSKTTRHVLTYVLDEPIFDNQGSQTNLYEGSFDNILDNDEIELLALWMIYLWKERKKSYVEAQREKLGTSDFNRLEGKKDQLTVLIISAKEALEEVKAYMQDFNTYSY
jgi:hypothetical protein